LYDKERLGHLFPGKDIRTSPLQKIPGALKHYQWLLPWMPTATEQHDLQGFDVVVSSSSAMAKGVITPTETLHVCYCHTPTRYLWSDTHRYVQELRYNRLIKVFVPPMLHKLRLWDQAAAQRVDSFVANSKYIAHRIQKYYHRDSIVIHPPVQTTQFSISPSVGNYFLAGGRLVSYKRFDLVIRAFNRLNIPLKIFGEGPEFANLRTLAKDNIEFLGHVDAETRKKLYSQAIAFIQPQIEDFGITPIESMASGRPVIAYAAGGNCETIVQDKTGIFFEEQTWEALADAVVRFKPEQFQPEIIKAYAEQFGVERFKRELLATVENQHAAFKQRSINCGI
jgi:glycosyltransferase involved in cell wall biosynthesis